MSGEQPAARIVDPRAVRVAASSTTRSAVTLEPAAVPLAPAPRMAGSGVLGGAATAYPPLETTHEQDAELVLVDGEPTRLRLEHVDDLHHVLAEGDGAGWTRTTVLLLPPGHEPGTLTGSMRREVVVDGWSIEVEIESERRASLRERARRGREQAGHHGPTEVRAIIPGRVIGVSIVPGDAVVAGQQLLVVEAMKMQNELRAPRDGVVSSVAVGPGRTIEVGDLLLVLQ